MNEENRAIYADHAATTPLSPAAREAMEPYLGAAYANPSAQYGAGLAARQAVEGARRTIARYLGCLSEEIYFTSGGSEGNSWAVWNGALRGLETGRKLLLTTPIEHHSLLRACKGMAPLGVSTQLLRVDAAGRVETEMLEQQLRRRPALVSLQYANNEVGTVQPMAELAPMVKESGALLHSDGVQAVGHLALPLDHIDLLTASAHKFGGPKGTGFLYAKHGTSLKPLIFGGSQERGVRGGTESVAGVVGMAAALDWWVNHREAENRLLTQLETEFRETLAAGCPAARFHGTEAGKLPGLVSVALPTLPAEQMVYRMDIKKVSISAGAACDQMGRKQPSHVLMAMGISGEEAMRTVRVSFGGANQPGDGIESAQRMLAALRQAGVKDIKESW
jgi:cysteine desulfurase